jgi:exodeoxyribonuclease VII small subunit
MKNFEVQMQNLEEILTSLTKDDLKLSEVTKLVKKAKELYDLCSKQLEEAKLEIEEVTNGKTNN